MGEVFERPKRASEGVGGCSDAETIAAAEIIVAAEVIYLPAQTNNPCSPRAQAVPCRSRWIHHWWECRNARVCCDIGPTQSVRGDVKVLQTGAILPQCCGGNVQIRHKIGEGGQGVVFAGQASIGSVAVKCLKDRSRIRDDRTRTRALVDMDLQSKCRALFGPMDLIDRADLVAHVTPLFEGVALSEYVYPGTGAINDDLAKDLFLGAAIAHCLSVQHDQCNIANGDIHLDQFKVRPVGERLSLGEFDLDNFYRPDLPRPGMIGKPDYIGPVTRKRWLAGRRSVPSIQEDLFSFGVVLHEILLRRHPGADAPTDSEAFHQSMSGQWLDDPSRPDRSRGLGGRPTACFNKALIDRFRCTLDASTSKRPSAAQWRRTLIRAACSVGACPSCTSQAVADKDRTRCPKCRSSFPTFQLVCSGGARIALTESEQVIGRQQCGGAMTISEQHCIVRREPPLTTLEPVGKNGAFLFTSSAWQRMPQSRLFPIEPGDRLRFADIELSVVHAGV